MNEEISESRLQNLTESVESIVTGIPAPIRENFLKAFSQLCTAAVDIPVAFLEGKASEIRALTESRVQIIKKQGQSLSEDVKVPQIHI